MDKFLYKKFPLFDLLITIKDNYLSEVEFFQKTPILQTTEINEIQNNSLVKILITQLDEYLRNGKAKLNVPIIKYGSLFQQRLCDEIKKIEPGKTMSYLNLAINLNSSPRDVGSGCGRNKIPLFIPCHRVISANGGVGGFMKNNQENSFNLSIKQWLLSHENN